MKKRKASIKWSLIRRIDALQKKAEQARKNAYHQRQRELLKLDVRVGSSYWLKVRAECRIEIRKLKHQLFLEYRMMV